VRIPGFTSTGSKRPEALFGATALADDSVPVQMVRAEGCSVWDTAGRQYTDLLMALGAVALGYGHPEVNRAAIAAIGNGVVGPLAPALEEELADRLHDLLPWLQQIRFLKTGAEAAAAAVRIARAATGRDLVLTCGYHGWLDGWQENGTLGVPVSVSSLNGSLPFNDVERGRDLIRHAGDGLACVMIEPVVVSEPSSEWLAMLRQETEQRGAVLVFDEIKTCFRIATGGAAERYRVEPDLVILGKALANGFPLAAVGGRSDLMAAATRTWISSTLATEMVSLAAALTTVTIAEREGLPRVLQRNGRWLLAGFERLARDHPDIIAGVAGIAEMCFLQFRREDHGVALARGAARRGLLFKRTAYNFVSLAHDEASLDAATGALDETLRGMESGHAG
jgi:glutamate-1-semialdehyde aminotransferase